MITTLSKPEGIKLEVRSLRKGYGGVEVLKGLDFDVRPGEVFVIMGPSGCGKSVLLKQLIGLEVPDSGEIFVDGLPVHLPETMQRCRIAVVFQGDALFDSLTVSENVGFYLAERRLKPPEAIAEIVARTLEQVGLSGIESKMPGELSGGMKKRVSIARALVIEPHLIFFDEPTRGLDPLTSVSIADVIVHLNKSDRVTTLVVTHDRDLAFAIADRIAFMDEGRLVIIGTPAEITASDDPYIRSFLAASFSSVGSHNQGQG